MVVAFDPSNQGCIHNFQGLFLCVQFVIRNEGDFHWFVKIPRNKGSSHWVDKVLLLSQLGIHLL